MTAPRQILMIEVDGPDAETAAARLEAVLPAVIAKWHDDDGLDATLLVGKLAPAA